jgi:Tfp pilus assembly protein PilF
MIGNVRGLWASRDKACCGHAIADYGRTIQLEPGDAKAFYNRATVHRMEGDYARAVARYDAFTKCKSGAAHMAAWLHGQSKRRAASENSSRRDGGRRA